MSALPGMAAHVARRVARLRLDHPVESLKKFPLYARTPGDFPPALASGVKIVEIRFVDPQGGLLIAREDATPEEAARRAAAAARAGAAVVAVWVERNFHAGDYSHLEAARASCPNLFLIARDVVLDPWQIERARAAGADAIELIPELLGSSLEATAKSARDIGLTPVVIGPDLVLRAA